jgi:FkbM family methyltransferase
MFQKIKQQLKEKLGVPSQAWSLQNLKANGFNPSVIYDIGAYSGMWTAEVMEIFPAASFYMFEGQQSKKDVLDQFATQHGRRVQYNIGLLGADDDTTVTFNEYETASSVLAEHFETEAARTTAKLNMLDSVIEKRDWSFPDFIKLDTQGYELEILKGGTNALHHAEAVLMEVSFIDIYKNAPLAFDVINFMKERGFFIYDICTLMRRPVDHALFQADMLFLKEGSKLVANKKWG